MRRRGTAAVAAVLAAGALGIAAPGAARACSPTAPPDPAVPTWRDLNGFALGGRQATVAEIARYLQAVDRASPRVRTGVYGASTRGRPLRYAVVADAGAHVEALAAGLRRLRAGEGAAATGVRPLHTGARKGSDPLRPAVWLTGGVHGDEPSGSDADMGVLYRLASGRDCETRREVRRLLVVLVPVQNPDGRTAGMRVNAAGFDLNRDWFARTQPESEARSALLERMPPAVLADQHEQGGSSFFFPPSADPIHHEVPRPALRAVDTMFGPALAQAFTGAHVPFVHDKTYDLFFMGYGDSVSSTLYGAAGMTFEQGAQAPYRERVAHHRLAAATVLRTAAQHADELLRTWGGQWTEARRQGAAGRLAPNLVQGSGHTVQFRVPATSVHAYAIRADMAGADAAALVERLRTVGVVVDRLTSALHVPSYRPYGATADGPADLPAGTYVMPMAQTAKHWVEAMLGVDAYVPFPYFYDVSSWSNPLLMGLAGGALGEPVPAAALEPVSAPFAPPAGAPAYTFAGDSVGALATAVALLRAGVPVARVPGTGEMVVIGDVSLGEVVRHAAANHVAVRALDTAPAGLVALRAPRVALLSADPATAGADELLSQDWAQFVLARRLGLEVTAVRAGSLAAKLAGGTVDVLLVPDGDAVPDGLRGPALASIRRFVAAGGTYVGEREQGVAVAREAGITAVRTVAPPAGLQIPGASLRVLVDTTDPVGWGSPAESFAFNTGDPILAGGRAVVSYPSGSPIFVSGSTVGTEALRGTPAATDEPLGAGRTVLFAFDAAFRAYVEGSERLLGNAVLAPTGGGGATLGSPVVSGRR